MATYIQGLTDYIPQIQPFQPDFNFFQKALEMKQGQYEAGYNKISSVYGKLLNSDLMREPNVQRRNEFFTGLDNEIKRLSGVDLSLPENVEKASKLFQPLIDNDYFRADMAFTKRYRGEKARADRLRNNPNPKDKGLTAWDVGDRALDYQAEDFAKSSDEESLNFAAPKYTPYVNAAKELFEFAKANDINPETLTKQGGYIIKTTNGPQAIPTLQNLFSSLIANDPRVKDMYSAQAYVDRKNYMKSNAEKFQGDEYAAETEYLKTKVNEINEFYRNQNKVDTETKDKTVNTKKVLEKKIQTEGVDPDLDKDIIEMYRQVVKDEQVITDVTTKNDEVLTETDAIDFDAMDRQGLRYRVDNAMTYFLMDRLAGETATSYATAKMKIDSEVDQYSLAATNHRYRLIEEATRFDNDKTLKLMDIVGEMYKNGGYSVPGAGTGSGFLSDMFNQGILSVIPGPGNVSGDTNISQQNASKLNNLFSSTTSYAQNNMDQYLAIQNARLKNAATPEERTLIEQEINSTLGLYTEEEKTVYETKEEAKFHFESGDYLYPDRGFPILQGSNTIAPFWRPDQYVPRVLNKFAESMLPGDTKVYEKKQMGYKSGLAKKNDKGEYELYTEGLKNTTDPNHNDYYLKVNDRINLAMATGFNGIDKNNPSLVEIQRRIDANNGEMLKNIEVLDKYTVIQKENNAKIAQQLSSVSGIDAFHSDQFFKSDFGRAKTETEYITDYVEAHKNDEQYYPRAKAVSAGFASGMAAITDEVRFEKMREDAEDKYEVLTEAYEAMSKNKTGNLNIQSFSDPNLLGGIDKYFSQAATYNFDPVAFNTNSFSIAIDAYTKDMLPAMQSESFRNQQGSKFVYGNGFDITAEDYAELENSGSAQNALNFMMQTAMLNYGGKPDQHPNRPTGQFSMHAVAANDATKVAMTWTPSRSFIDENKGTDDLHGATWDLAQMVANGQSPQITFFMDADKAKSVGFLSMQQTREEFLVENGGLNIDAYNQYGGNIQFAKNATGGYSYTGMAKAFNAAGQLVQQPIFGVTYEDINSLSNTYSEMFAGLSTVNQRFLQSASSNSNNKIYNTDQLVEK